MFLRSVSLAAIAASGLLLTGCGSSDDAANFELKMVSRIATGVFDEGAAEIVAHDAASQRLFTVNGDAKAIDVFDIANPATPLTVSPGIDVAAVAADAGAPNSVAASNGLVAVAIQNDDKQANGYVAIYNAADLTLQNLLSVGALPDMLRFTPDGQRIIVANEGEPNDDYTVDPEGTISLIDLSNGVAAATVSSLDFQSFNAQADSLRSQGVRVFGPNASVAQDLEPEFIAVNNAGTRAWVALQENNAMAVLDLVNNRIDAVLPLGVKDHSQSGNELDASDRDDAINIRNWPVFGFYQPDTIAYYEIDGTGYVVTANEGDAREYEGTPGFVGEDRVKDLNLDANAFPNAAELQTDEQLGRLTVTTAQGDTDGDGDFDQLFSYGARSFSIRRASDMALMFDSGSDFEMITASEQPDNFNSDNDENGSFDSRSDAKGPEPEALAVAQYGNKTYAFVGLERMGGIMVYDISDPTAAVFVDYQLDRDFSVDDVEANLAEAGDLGPEGLLVIPASASPNGRDLLVVASEISGTTTLYEINNP